MMAEKEYIERGELIRLIDKVFDKTDPHGEEQIGILRCRTVARTIPAADVVEVVRCKDCSYWQRNTGIADSPNGQCFYHDICTNGFGFCNYGAKMDGGKTK